MPVKSYIIFPEANNRPQLINDLQGIPNLEVITAINGDLLILVTDTHSDREEERLTFQIQSLKHLKHMVLVSAFND